MLMGAGNAGAFSLSGAGAGASIAGGGEATGFGCAASIARNRLVWFSTPRNVSQPLSADTSMLRDGDATGPFKAM